MANLYRATADWYDLDQRNVVQDDIPFYIERAKQLQGDVLELACGTGRVMIPMANAGINVWGLDLSKEMLDQLDIKKDSLEQEVKERIHTIHGDMSNFDLGRKF
ncbi:class I SAM-dependent methyltransferase [Tepidibacillus marianensis]|uniref:class I SAM-dependent methyltransferase n=1 Tax=Tepidibacillus marianensis TaxID=3131995 RepID=UPI0030D4E220